MTGTLEALIASAQQYDFGLFLLTPDDSIESREIRGHTARDNVWFELGLFLGELGRDRCFALMQYGPDSKRVKIPSDLLGITLPRLDAGSADSLAVSIAQACVSLRPLLRQKRFRELSFQLVDGWSFDPEMKCFRLVLSERLVSENFHRLRGHALVVVVRRYNDKVDRDSDHTVVVGPERRVPREPQRIVLEVQSAPLLDIEGEPRLDGFLFLMPQPDAAPFARTIEDILAAGGRLIEARGRGIPEHVRKE
jgi:hypothetical protein